MHVLIADDHDLVREALASFLETVAGITVTQASTLADALSKLSESRPNIVLLDYDMPGMNGLLGLEQAREHAENIPVALMSGVASIDIAEQALENGAAGFVPKTLGVRAIVSAINFMVSGEQFAPVRWMREAHANSQPVEPEIMLTSREMQVLVGLSEGKSNKEIARDLDLQEVTVKLHVKSLFRKLDAKNRTHAALLGKERGLV